MPTFLMDKLFNWSSPVDSETEFATVRHKAGYRADVVCQPPAGKL
jgi:hypothetical protein